MHGSDHADRRFFRTRKFGVYNSNNRQRTDGPVQRSHSGAERAKSQASMIDCTSSVSVQLSGTKNASHVEG
jgi:hypothetical protein